MKLTIRVFSFELQLMKIGLRSPESSSNPFYSSQSPPSASINYIAEGGGKVHINLPINPWTTLGLTSNKASRDSVKVAFQQKTQTQQRQSRALVALANHILTSTEPRYQRIPDSDLYTIKNRDHFVVAACGNTKELKVLVRRDPSLVKASDEHGRTLLYLASKSGFYDMVKMLLQKGADINKVQRDGSTPLHGAAYFGHFLVVGLLLEYGAQTKLTNTWGQTALQESKSPDIEELIKNASSDYIFSLKTEMSEKKIVSEMRPIEFKGQHIAKELIRHPDLFDSKTRAEMDTIFENWEMGWHGTNIKNVESILKQGLLPSGTNGIKPPPGHFRLDTKWFDVENWAAAIFLSPSVLYAGHAAYSERVMSNNQQWCVLIKAYCPPGSYKAYNPTVLRYFTIHLLRRFCTSRTSDERQTKNSI